MKFNGKRASANMWWIIIGAVIALVVMIILMVMFTGKSTKLEGGLSSCESKGGKCVVNCPQGTLHTTAFDCANAANKCCMGPGKTCIQNENVKEVCGTGSECDVLYNGKYYCS